MQNFENNFGVSAHLMQSENLSDLHEMGEDTLINVVCVWILRAGPRWGMGQASG